MLMHPGRQKFEQIRARWEAAQPGEEEPEDMVGRKLSQQPAVSGEAHPNAGSKFRRKLSHGLASISNTLSQRKTTPGRQPANKTLLAVTASATSTFARQCDAPLSPTRKLTLLEQSNGSPIKDGAPANHESPTKSVDLDATPKALPRARTTSFLPRPVKLESVASVVDSERTVKIPSPVPVTDPKLRDMPSKIPTPSPPLSERRGPSPRQHLSHYTSLQTKCIAAGHAFAGNSTGSPSKATTRSRTTPNLMKVANSPQPPNYMAPRKVVLKTATASPTIQKSTLQENIPTNKRVSQRHSQIREKPLKRESLAVPTTVANRRSFGPGAPLVQSKQSDQGTPLTAKKRLGSNLAPQTPVTAKRVQRSEQVVEAQVPVSIASSSSIIQPRLMGPRNPPTPTPLATEAAGARPAFPRSNTDKDLQRKTLGTPNGLGGVWRSSRALAAANHEVRRLPRSSTFHNFGRSLEAAPPVPPIPEQYRTPSLSNLVETFFVHPENSHRAQHLRMVSDAASRDSIPEGKGEEINPKDSIMASRTYHSRSSSLELSGSSDDLVALPPLPPPGHSSPGSLSNHSQTSLPRSQNNRPWSISDHHYEDSANIEPHLQVRDYMPPLYWAGRFQSRFDQWRTEAMNAELNPKHRPEGQQGQLGQCKLNQEKLAACYIFAQLRDLCLTGQAADSLWVFESRYRKDNKLLGNADYPMQPLRKHDDQGTHKGAFGRAVRKLTPRKSSFVNLMKGKGWGKDDEAKPPDGPRPSLETSPGSS